jgi:hypothetical protein
MEVPEEHEGAHEEVSLIETLDFRVQVSDMNQVVDINPVLRDGHDAAFWSQFDPRVIHPDRRFGPVTIKDKVILYVQESLEEGTQPGECEHCGGSSFEANAVDEEEFVDFDSLNEDEELLEEPLEPRRLGSGE